MKIIVKVSEKELDEMEVSDIDELKSLLYSQLDDASLPHGMPAIELVGYNIEIVVFGE